MADKNKLLIVDDQEINRQILKKLLSDSYDIEEAADGAQALKQLHEMSEDISAVLLDLIMPVMDGYQFMEAVSKDPVLSEIPVIVLTAADKQETEDRALKLGARDFISKPYNPDVLRRRVSNLIELYESNLCITAMETDPVTGLSTKEAFCREASAILAANPGISYMLVATDIEHFKLVNDSFGTAEGDKLLAYTGAQLYKQVSIVNGICCRHNADHFIALAPMSADGGGLQNIIAQSEKDYLNYPLGMKISLRFGVYPIDDPTVSISLMCDRAIIAVESIKGRYDTVSAYYDDSVRRKLLREQNIIDEMKPSLTRGDFQVYLQPKYSLTTELIASAEALVRWNHPVLGFLSPGEFIPLFEKNGFITALDAYVWETVCASIRSWIDLGNPALPISVNVSRVDLYNPKLGELLLSLLNKYRLAPKYISLEITESAYTENVEQLIEAVKKLKKLGFMIEMDDFGSGYSSLNTLSRLPIDIIKLDVGFLQSEKRYSARSILSFIVSLAKWMDLTIVAEGVETKEHLNLLRALKCDMGQGYLFARPMPISDFERLLAKQHDENRDSKETSVADMDEIHTALNMPRLIICD